MYKFLLRKSNTFRFDLKLQLYAAVTVAATAIFITKLSSMHGMAISIQQTVTGQRLMQGKGLGENCQI